MTMKLRCTPNSIRIRIRKNGIEELAAHGKVIESVLFPNGQKLIYGLEIQEDQSQLHAHFQDGTLQIHLPSAMADRWIQSDEVGLEREQPLPDGQNLRLLIEKDFPCQHQEPTENADTFQELAKKKG